MNVLALASVKGGVGKSTIAVHVAAALATQGARTLLVDLDPQSHATAALAVDIDPEHTVAQWLPWNHGTPRLHPLDGYETLSVLPAHLALADEEYEAIEKRVSPNDIAEPLRRLAEPFDWVILDLPPTLAFWSWVGLLAADQVLIPVEPARVSYIGLRQLLVRLEAIRVRQNPRLRVLGAVASRVDSRTHHGQNFRSMLADIASNTSVFETFIPSAAAIGHAQDAGVTVFDLAPDSAISRAFQDLTEEVKARWVA